MQQIWLYNKRPWLFLFSLVMMVGCFVSKVDWQSIADHEKQKEQAVKELGYANVPEAGEALLQVFTDALERADCQPLDLDYAVKAQARIEQIGEAACWPEYRLRVYDVYRRYWWAYVGGDPLSTSGISAEMQEKSDAFMKEWHEAEVRHRQTVKFKSIDHEIKPLTLADLWAGVVWFGCWYFWLMMPAALSVIVLLLHDNGWCLWLQSRRVLLLATCFWPLGLACVYGESRSIKLLREVDREYRHQTGERLSFADLREVWRHQIGGRVPYWAIPIIALVWVLGHLNLSPAMASDIPVVQMVLADGAIGKVLPDQPEKDWAIIPVSFGLVILLVIVMVLRATLEMPRSQILRPNSERGPPTTAEAIKSIMTSQILSREKRKGIGNEVYLLDANGI